MKNSYLVENNLIHFRRANENDNFEEIIELIFDTDPYIYPFWFKESHNKSVELFKTAMMEDGFIFNYNNLYIAFDTTMNKIVGFICAIDKSVNLKYDYESLKNINKYYKKTIDDYIMPIIEDVESYDNETIYIPNVCIKKDLRGKKIGTKLLGYYIKQMEKNGYNKFILDCLLHNLPAKNLYHSFGFKEMKLINGFTGYDDELDVVTFIRKKGDYLPEDFNI